MSVNPVIIRRTSNGKMPRQISDSARHYPIANNVCNEAVLLVAHCGRDHCFLSDVDLAPRDKLGPAHIVGVACPAIFIRLHPDDVYLRLHQTLSKECTINNWMRDHPYTSLRGSLDNIMLLGAHHISRLGSGQWQQEYSPTESRIGKDSLQGSTSRGARAPFLGWWWHSPHTPMRPGGAAKIF